MKAIIGILGIVLGLVVVAWAWPLITAVVVGGGAGVLGAFVVLFVAFMSWYICNGLSGGTSWAEINETTMGLWGCLYLLLGFAGGIYAYIHATGNFFTKYVPLMAGGAALLGMFPAWFDNARAKKSGRRRSPRSKKEGVGLTRDGRIVQHGEGNMADLDIDLDISAPVSNRG